MSQRIRIALAVASFGLLRLAEPALATGPIISVSNTNASGAGSLAGAISAANAAGGGATIAFTNNLGTFNIPQLPDITAGVTINGGSGNTLSGQNARRIFFVSAPAASVNIFNLTLSNGLAQGGTGGRGGGTGGGGAGLGGAVFINLGNVNFSNVAFTSNTAHGGNGGDVLSGGGGGGGGFSFAGGNGSSDASTFLGAGGGGGARTSAGFDAGAQTGGNGGGVHGGAGGAIGSNGTAAPAPDGGGGGGGFDSTAYTGTTFAGFGASGYDFGGGGGGGGSLHNNANTGGSGGFGGGGGGGADAGSGFAGKGGAGGFGGGGGGGGGTPNEFAYGPAAGGAAGFGGGAGGLGNQGTGGGGAGFGGAVFVRSETGASASFLDSSFDAGSVIAGAGGTSALSGHNGGSGSAAGGALFLMGGNVNLAVSPGNTRTIAGSIAQSSASSLSVSGGGTLVLSANNSGIDAYSGGTSVTGAGSILAIAGSGTIPGTQIDIGSGATLRFDRHDTFGIASVATPAISITDNGGTIASHGTFTTLGALTLNGGTLLANGGANVNYQAFQLRGTVTVSGSVASMIMASASAFPAVHLSGVGGGTTFAVNSTGAAGGDLLVSTPLVDGFDLVSPGNLAVSSLTKSGTGELVLSAANRYTGSTTVNGGTLTLTSSGSLASATIGVAAGATLNVAGSLASGATINDNGAVSFGGSSGGVPLTRAIAALNIGSGVAAVVSPSAYPLTPAVLQLNTLGLSAGSTLDLKNNELLTHLSLAAISSDLASQSIFTSSLGGMLGAVDLGNGQTEVRYTLAGDTNLDGAVDVSDLGRLATNYGSNNASWAQGDFNNSGVVDVADLGALATNYGTDLSAAPAGAPSSIIPSTAAVPEPGTLTIGFTAIVLFSRRRRRRL